MKWTLLMLMLASAVVLAAAQQTTQDIEEDNELVGEEQEDTASDDTSTEEEDDDQVSLRVVRSAQQSEDGATGGRNRGAQRGQGRKDQAGGRRGEGKGKGKVCRYNKGPWSECDTATNMRSRSLTLRKGDSSCEQSKSISKKCKKAGAGGSRRRAGRNPI